MANPSPPEPTFYQFFREGPGEKRRSDDAPAPGVGGIGATPYRGKPLGRAPPWTTAALPDLRADAVPPTPKKRGAATSDGTGGASGKECFLPVPRIFCGSNEGCTGSTHWGTDCAANTVQEREGRDAFGSGH